ncbi:MFS general substrate transporter [Myriangium duriaei CBS 260.36]|uniref:MFS general substrate transporter n=1 Tax=Myriangium duriaei CBS 260.36 TaxID=1168546 RepID=A0A9P4J6P0_9PEZI|nr:MFS general substrate transporter [Myriangium duriaei CBS 260.36]
MGKVQHVLAESGLPTLLSSCLDTKLLCAQRFVRMFAYGGSTLMLAAHLSNLGNSDRRIGLFMTLTLFGDIAISLVLTLFADRLGRRMILLVGSLMMTISGFVFATSESFAILLIASVFGVISPSGDEVGPFRAVEESTVAHLTPDAARFDVFAWYTLLGIAGQAIGALVTGWVTSLLLSNDVTIVEAYKTIFYGYGAIGAVKLVLTYLMSSRVEAIKPTRQTTRPSGFLPRFRKETVTLTIQLSILFGIDNFASGLVSFSWITYYFQRKFGISEGDLGTLFSVATAVSAVSVLFASAIAKRLGNVKTMAFTHLPSTVAVMFIPMPSSLSASVILLFLRNSCKSMDTAPRAALLAAIIPSDERTAVNGIANVVKTVGQSFGPLATGALSTAGHFGVAFVLAGALKIGYDLTFLFMFAHKEKAMMERQKEIAERDDAARGLLDDEEGTSQRGSMEGH